MTEEEFKAKVKALAEQLQGVEGLEDVEFMDEDTELKGEPASICLEFDGTMLALGVLPV